MVRFAQKEAKKAASKERRKTLEEVEAELDRYGAASVMPQDWHTGLNAARARVRYILFLTKQPSKRKKM